MRRDNTLPRPVAPPGAGDKERAMMLAIAASHPLWMVQRWLERYGEADTLKLLAANNRCASVLYFPCQMMGADDEHVAWTLFPACNTSLNCT